MDACQFTPTISALRQVQKHGRARRDYRNEVAEFLHIPAPWGEKFVRPDVVDAVLDALMIARLVDQYGASKRDIANTFGYRMLGKSRPVRVMPTSTAWSIL